MDKGSDWMKWIIVLLSLLLLGIVASQGWSTETIQPVNEVRILPVGAMEVVR